MLDTVPLPSPFATPTGFSVNDPVFFPLCEFPIGNIQTDAVTFAVTFHVFETFRVCFGVPWFNRSAFKRKRFIRYDQGVIHADNSSETSTGFTGAERGVETESRIGGLLILNAAIGARQTVGKAAPQLLVVFRFGNNS